MFELDGLCELKNVVVGRDSFKNRQQTSSFRIVNCPKLKSIQIGYKSFSVYYSFELNNLPSLQSIEMGEESFHWTPLFSLAGLIDGLV